MNEAVSINIKLCNRTYRIKVDASNEGLVRERIKEVQTKIDLFHKQFPGRDDHDYMAMTMIDYVTSKDETNESFNDNRASIIAKLETLNHLLDT
jgi:hypothetical protein